MDAQLLRIVSREEVGRFLDRSRSSLVQRLKACDGDATEVFDATTWNYHPEHLHARGLVHPLRFEPLAGTTHTQTFALSPAPLLKDISLDPVGFTEYFESQRKLDEEFIEYFLDIPQRVEHKLGGLCMRWPIRITMQLKRGEASMSLIVISQVIRLPL